MNNVFSITLTPTPIKLSDLGINVTRYVFYYEDHFDNSKGYIFYDYAKLPAFVYDSYFIHLQLVAICSFSNSDKLQCGDPPQAGDVVLDYEHDTLEVLHIKPL